MKKTILLLSACAVLAGCATSRQTITTTETNPTNGVVTVNSTKSSVSTVFQSAQVIEKIRASNGKTQSIGVSGLDQRSDASTFVEALGAFATQLGNAYSAALTGVQAKTTAASAPVQTPVVVPGEWSTNYAAMNPAQKAAFLELLKACPDGSCVRIK